MTEERLKELWNSSAERQELITEIRRLRKAINLVLEQERFRGYPNGMEWMRLIEKVRNALVDDESPEPPQAA